MSFHKNLSGGDCSSINGGFFPVIPSVEGATVPPSMGDFFPVQQQHGKAGAESQSPHNELRCLYLPLSFTVPSSSTITTSLNNPLDALTKQIAH